MEADVIFKCNRLSLQEGDVYNMSDAIRHATNDDRPSEPNDPALGAAFFVLDVGVLGVVVEVAFPPVEDASSLSQKSHME